MRAIERRIQNLEFILQGMDTDLTDLGEAMDALGNFCADQARKLNDLENAFRARVGGILHRWGNRPVFNQPPIFNPPVLIPQPEPQPAPSTEPEPPILEPQPFGPGAGASTEELPTPSGLREEQQRQHMLAFIRSAKPLPPDFFLGRTNF